MGPNEESMKESAALSGLSITDLDGNKLQLPKVYIQHTIPVSTENIPTQNDVNQWEYSESDYIKNINTDVGLQINQNVPKASEPCQVINSQGEGSYACKTIFGWAVYGLMKKNETFLHKLKFTQL